MYDICVYTYHLVLMILDMNSIDTNEMNGLNTRELNVLNTDKVNVILVL